MQCVQVHVVCQSNALQNSSMLRNKNNSHPQWQKAHCCISINKTELYGFPLSALCMPIPESWFPLCFVHKVAVTPTCYLNCAQLTYNNSSYVSGNSNNNMIIWYQFVWSFFSAFLPVSAPLVSIGAQCIYTLTEKGYQTGCMCHLYGTSFLA